MSSPASEKSAQNKGFSDVSLFGNALNPVSENLALFKARAKYVPDFENGGLRLASIAEFSFPVFSPKWLKPRRDDDDGVDLERVKIPLSNEIRQMYKERAAHRARVNVFDLAICNQFDLFCTFTYDPAQFDRTSYDETYGALKTWLSNRVQRRGLKYVAVPEYHRDGEAIHFHMLCNSEAVDLVDSGHRRAGKKVYNIPSWTFGFSTAQFITGERSVDFVSKYVSKYMTKSNGRKIGGRYYLSGGDLIRPTYIYGDTLEDLYPGDLPAKYDREISQDWGTYREVSYI